MSTQVEPVTIGRSRNPLMARRMGSWLSPMQSMENWLDDRESRWMPGPQGLFGHRTPRVDLIERDQEICVKEGKIFMARRPSAFGRMLSC
jgi:hypothetical protein